MTAPTFRCCACCWSPTNLDGVDPDLHADGERDMHDVSCSVCDRPGESAWREALGALRLTLAGSPVDVDRARAECEALVRVMNAGAR